MASLNKILLFLCLIANSAFANLISLETRDLTGTFDQSDMLVYWNSLDAGTVQTLSDLDNFQTGRNNINMVTIDIRVLSSTRWDLDIALDAGLGAEVYVDGTQVAKRTDDLWWGMNWDHGDVIGLDDLSLSFGLHEIVILWAERCCDGPNSVRLFDQGSDQFASVSNASIAAATAAEVSEPATLALFGFSVVGLMALRRRVC